MTLTWYRLWLSVKKICHEATLEKFKGFSVQVSGFRTLTGIKVSVFRFRVSEISQEYRFQCSGQIIQEL